MELYTPYIGFKFRVQDLGFCVVASNNGESNGKEHGTDN